MEAQANDVRHAVRREDWDALRPLLHPYLHWTDSAGVRVRGRRNVALGSHRAQADLPRT
jgi:hypothetical protein